MKALFGLPFTSVAAVEEEISRSFTYRVYGAVSTESTEPLEGIQVILFSSVHLFVSQSDSLLDWDGVVLLFDAPPKCEALLGLEMLGVANRTESFRYTKQDIPRGLLSEKIAAALKGDDDVVFHNRKHNLLPWLLGQTSASQLDRIQTWKYRVPPAMRDSLTKTLVKWFFAPKPTVDDLKERLTKEVGNGQGKKATENLFEGNNFADLKKAILQVHTAKAEGKSFSVDKVASAHGVSPFDIRYMVIANDRYSKVQEYEPGFELAQAQRAFRLNKPCDLLGDLNETGTNSVQAS